MIVLDQHRVIQPEAVIETAATAHRIFLQDSQTGQGLAGADDTGPGAFDGIHQGCGRRRHAGQMAREIQRHPLGGEDGAGGAGNRGQHIARLPRRAAIGDGGGEGQGWLDQLERDLSGNQAGDAARFARHQFCRGGFIRGQNEFGGDVAGAAHILGQSGADLRLDQKPRGAWTG